MVKIVAIMEIDKGSAAMVALRLKRDYAAEISVIAEPEQVAITEPEIEVVYSDRGFKHCGEVRDSKRSLVTIYESSAASEPYIWLKIHESSEFSQSQDQQTYAHLTLEQAGTIRDQLDYLIRNHYQLS